MVMIIDATSSFAAKIFANTFQRDVGTGWKVQVEYSSKDTTPYDWFDIEFCLIEKSNGKRHEIPEEIFQ
jgi:hypothetical protein|tara:strand:+ start:86 stop:292 length:207 start_codon:yes stop_codon:yes gene_type:complete